MARTRPSGEPKRKKSDTSKSKRPRLTSESWGVPAAGASASSFNTLEWMLPEGGMAGQRRARTVGVSTLRHRCILRAGCPTLCYRTGTPNQRPLLIPSTEARDLALTTQANIWLEQSSANLLCRGQVVSLKDFMGQLHSTTWTHSAMPDSRRSCLSSLCSWDLL